MDAAALADLAGWTSPLYRVRRLRTCVAAVGRAALEMWTPIRRVGGSLALKLHRLALHGPGGTQGLALTSPALCAGFNEIESDGKDRIWRWSTGDALLDVSKLIPPETATTPEIACDQALLMWNEPVGCSASSALRISQDQ